MVPSPDQIPKHGLRCDYHLLMARKRFQSSLGNIPCNPRTTLDARLHSDVDLFLKTLKGSHKRFQTAFASMQVEGQVLERIFYKGKNQHRGSLLWRKLSDLRKFTRRTEALAPSQTMTAFCQSFFTKAEYVHLNGNGYHAHWLGQRRFVQGLVEPLPDWRIYEPGW